MLDKLNNSETNNTQTPPSNTTARRWIVLIGLVFLLGLGLILANRVTTQSTTTQLPPAPVKGHPAPEISLESIDGTTVNLSDFKGKPVVINFWATWCAPCRAEMPDLQAIHRELGDDAVIFSVNASNQDGGNIEGFLEEFGITFLVLLDAEGKAFKDYKILGLPTTIFVNRDGIVHQVFTGAVNKAYVESTLSEL